MKIIPACPYDNNSRAELKFFDALVRAEPEVGSCIAFHSLGLTEHCRKREGEADFVLISTYGLFVVEVKGGGIVFEDGVWYTKNRKGTYSIQDPFKQASEAVHAIDGKIKKFSGVTETRIPLGHAVAFPDTLWCQHGAEWDKEMICDSEDLKNSGNFDQWLHQLFCYWTEQRPNNSNFLSESDVEAIVNYLRPNFELVQPLFNQIDDAINSSLKLTQEQYHYVDMAMNNRRVICDGGAGTGKTFLAAELARRFVQQGKTVALVCKSFWLKNYLSTRFMIDGLVVMSIQGIRSAIRRSGVDEFDVIIVDEGQDLLSKSDLDELDDIVVGGLDDGQWYFFHDANNQACLVSSADSSCLEWLKARNNPALFSLNINCRNTSNILSLIQQSLDCDVGKAALIDGPEVTEYYGSNSQLLIKLSELLTELRNSDIEGRDVTILSPFRSDKSIISLLPSDVLMEINILDDYKVRKYPYPPFSFAEIVDFKGLENEVVILLDLVDPKELCEHDKTLHYVGMSRARAKLYCFWKTAKEHLSNRDLPSSGRT